VPFVPGAAPRQKFTLPIRGKKGPGYATIAARKRAVSWRHQEEQLNQLRWTMPISEQRKSTGKTRMRMIGNNFVGMRQIVALILDKGYLEAKRYAADNEMAMQRTKKKEIDY
jgi:hypothetical protein